MPQNKHRLQLALYARPKHPGTYHYALFVAPKESGQHASPPTTTTKHHVKNTLQNVSGEVSQPWRYERLEIPDIALEQRLLVRIIIAKVATSIDHVNRILETVPIYQVGDQDEEKARSFTCRTWIRDALGELRSREAVTKLEDWEVVERRALEFVDKKREQRRWSGSWKGRPGVPLLDLLEGKELVE